MQPIRHLLPTHRSLAALVVAAALLLRLLVPAGYMPVRAGSGVALAICPGVVATPAMHHMGGHHDSAPRAESPCAFADLALPIVGSVDPVLLVAAIAFVMALGIARRTPRCAPVAVRLRPPSQAPPALA